MNPREQRGVGRSPLPMVAHVAIVECEPGQADQVVRECEAGLIPAARAHMGYRGIYVLVERALGRVVCLALWDTDQDARAYEQGEACRAHLAAIADGMNVPTSGEVYEVRIEA